MVRKHTVMDQIGFLPKLQGRYLIADRFLSIGNKTKNCTSDKYESLKNLTLKSSVIFINCFKIGLCHGSLF